MSNKALEESLGTAVGYECRVCGETSLRELEVFGSLPRVTSDSRPWNAGGRLAVCGDCGTVQKLQDARWLDEISEIYGSYAIYHQSNGAEQPIFAGDEAAPVPRSARLVDFLDKTLSLPNALSLLDFGCGTGSALRTFSARHPEWSLYGCELSDANRERLQSIPGFVELFTCAPEQLSETFDLITLIHSLEHVLDPVETLSALAKRLAYGGHLFVQVPDCGRTPYDLVIADHMTHFTLASLGYAARRAGLQIMCLSDKVLTKELSLVVAAGSDRLSASGGPDAAEGVRRVAAQVNWLRAQGDNVRTLAQQSPRLGIFGTSISATWLYSFVADSAAFFVDEDPGRIGREHLGLPILAPDAVPKEADVYVPLIPDVANAVAGRLRSSGLRCHVPPTIETNQDNREAAVL
jgi:SAM-dependent methyltransferase